MHCSGDSKSHADDGRQNGETELQPTIASDITYGRMDGDMDGETDGEMDGEMDCEMDGGLDGEMYGARDMHGVRCMVRARW